MTSQNKATSFFLKYPLCTFKKGEILIQPGNTIDDIYYIQSGSVKMFALSPDGEEVTLTIFKPGAYFPIMIPLSERPNTYYFQVQEDFVGYKAPLRDVLSFLQKDPEVLFNLTVSFSKAMMGLTTRIETLLGNDAYEKIIRLLIYFAEKNPGETSSEIALSQEEIASWLGLQRETVSRKLHALKSEMIIETADKHILILDLPRLKQKAGV